MGSTGAPPLPPSISSHHSSSFSSNVKTVLRICDCVVSSFLDHFRAFDRNGTVNWSKVVFLTTCFVAMAGCGLLTSLLRRRNLQSPSKGKRFRLSTRKNHTKTAAGTVTSSDEEDYDSNDSLHPANGSLSEKDGSIQHNEQSVEGLPTPLWSFSSLYCF